MTKPASRLITLILLLQNRPNQKAADLAGELGVSVRTLHRYFSDLDDMGIPIYAERGPYGGFSLVRGYKMPPLVVSPEEAVAGSKPCCPSRSAKKSVGPGAPWLPPDSITPGWIPWLPFWKTCAAPSGNRSGCRCSTRATPGPRRKPAGLTPTHWPSDGAGGT